MKDILEKNINLHLERAKYGDQDAQNSLHNWICIALSLMEKGEKIPESVFNLIYNQHADLAAGESAAKATFTERPPNKWLETTKREAIYNMAAFMIAANKQRSTKAYNHDHLKSLAKTNKNFSFIEAGSTQKVIFKEVAKNFGMTPGRVKRIYFDVKKEKNTSS